MDNSPPPHNINANTLLGNNPDFMDLVKTHLPDDESPYNELSINCNYYEECDFITKFKNCKSVSLLSLNIQSISSKFNELKSFIAEMQNNNIKFDFIALQELWCINDPAVYNLPDYHSLIYNTRTKRSGGGVGFYINKCYNFKILHNLSLIVDGIYESIVVSVDVGSKQVILASIYRPNTPINNLTSNEQLLAFNEELLKLMDELSNLKKPVYIAGDMNLDVLKFMKHKITDDYINNAFASGFIQLITKPTRCQNNSATLLDHILTNELKNQYTCGVLINDISDHFPVFHFLNDFQATVPLNNTVTSRNFTQASIGRFMATLKNLTWIDVTNTPDTQTSYDIFHTTFLTFLICTSL